MLDSGTTAIATSSDTAETVIANSSGVIIRHGVTVINEGAVAGFFSINNGNNWFRLPAGPASVTLEIDKLPFAPVVKVKRIASGSDVTGVYAFAW